MFKGLCGLGKVGGGFKGKGGGNKGNNNNIEANQNEVCGGTQNVFATNIRQRPYSTVALCVMVIAFILLGLSLRPKPSAASRLPPPEQMLLLSAAGP